MVPAPSVGVPSAVVTAAAGAGVAVAAWWGLARRPPGGTTRWLRRNHRGGQLSLLEGPAYAGGALVAVLAARGVPSRLRVAGAVAVTGAAVFGAVDDLHPSEAGQASKGLRGHLGALTRGELTTGGLKVVGIGASGLVAGVLAVPDVGDGRRRRVADTLCAGALVAGAANLVNLLDLRPGRALKVVLAHAPAMLGDDPAAVLVAAAAGPALALLPHDLGERAMLGDTGANAAGALLGTALASRLGRRGRCVALAGVVALTVASERVSFTRVIESTPVLRELDALGRRPR